MRLAVLLLVLLIFSGCSKKDPFTRKSQDSIGRPGLILIGVSKESLSFYLNQNSLHGRELGENSRIFDVEETDAKKLKDAFPDAEIIRDQVFFAPQVDKRVIAELTPQQARATAQYQLKSISLQEAQMYSSGEGVVVAVIDTGMNVERYDLKSSVWANPFEIPDNKLDDDRNGYIDDVNGWNFAENNPRLLDAAPHGTMTAALIASPLTGIAPRAKVIGLKVTDKNGAGSISAMVEAILYARKTGAQIINLSMGSLNVQPELQRAINDLMADDVILIQSAGNSSAGCADNQSISALNGLSKFISVAALNLPPASLNLAGYSNYGECVNISAPSGEGPTDPYVFGRGIVAAYSHSRTKFYLYHGTSAAAPVVTGVAALVKSVRPDLTAAQVKTILLGSATRHEILKGRVNNQRAINALNAVKSALAQ